MIWFHEDEFRALRATSKVAGSDLELERNKNIYRYEPNIYYTTGRFCIFTSLPKHPKPNTNWKAKMFRKNKSIWKTNKISTWMMRLSFRCYQYEKRRLISIIDFYLIRISIKYVTSMLETLNDTQKIRLCNLV